MIKVNRRGFTLIEVLAVVVLIGIIAILIVPSLLGTVSTGKNTSYEIIIKNIVTSSKMYYEECEYGDLSDEAKYGEYACKINDSKVTITLDALANTGFLDSTFDKEQNKKVVIDPRNNNDISSCSITITKTKNEKGKVTYTVTTSSSDDKCPTEYGSVN